MSSIFIAVVCFICAGFFLAFALRMFFMGKERRTMYEENRLAMKLCKMVNRADRKMSASDWSNFDRLEKGGIIVIKSGDHYVQPKAEITLWALKRVWGRI